MLAFLRSALYWVAQQVVGGAGNSPVSWGPASRVIPWLQGINNGIKTGVEVGSLLAWALEGQRQAWVSQRGRIGNAAYQYDQAIQQLGHAIDFLVHTSLPNSFHHVYGKVGAQVITPLKHAIASLGAGLTDVDKRARRTEDFAYNTVWPHVKDWMGFNSWWQQYFAGIALQLIRWFAHPGEWTDWLAPAMAGSLLSWLTTGGHEQTADNYTLAWIHRAPALQAAVCDAILATLASPYAGH